MPKKKKNPYNDGDWTQKEMDLFAQHIDQYDHLEEKGKWKGGCKFCDAADSKSNRIGIDGMDMCLVCPLGDGVDGESPCEKDNSYIPILKWPDGCVVTFLREGAPKSWVRKRRAELIKALDEFGITIK